MATEKLFSIAGISTVDNDTKIRFANDISRIKILVKNGHTDIKLINLPEPMNKFECVRYLDNDASFQDAVSQDLINEYYSKHGKTYKGPAVRVRTEDEEFA